MDVYKHKHHTVYKLSKRITLFKQHNKAIFWFKGKPVKNFRFKIHPHKQWRYFHWLIRQPYFYFAKDNCGIYIGTPNKYIQFERRWWQKSL
jgi:hypothetical protein